MARNQNLKHTLIPRNTFRMDLLFQNFKLQPTIYLFCLLITQIHSRFPLQKDEFNDNPTLEVTQCRRRMPDSCSYLQRKNIKQNTHVITVNKQAMVVADCDCCLKLRITDYLFENYLTLTKDAKTFDFFSFILKDSGPGSGPNPIGCLPNNLFNRLKYVVTNHSALEITITNLK